MARTHNDMPGSMATEMLIYAKPDVYAKSIVYAKPDVYAKPNV